MANINADINSYYLCLNKNRATVLYQRDDLLYKKMKSSPYVNTRTIYHLQRMTLSYHGNNVTAWKQ